MLKARTSSFILLNTLKCLKSTSKELPTTSSFVMNMFNGDLKTKELLPFPNPLTAEQKESLEQITDPISKVLENMNDAQKNDQTGTFDPELIKELKSMGAFGLQVPEELNGVGLSNTEYARLVYIIGRYDLALAIHLGSHQSIGFKGITLFGNPEQKKKYLPDLASGDTIAAFCLTEPSNGSDAANIKTKAELSSDGKHYILNGQKVWISNGGWANVFTVFAQVQEKQEDGSIKNRPTAFIVERQHGAKHGDPEKKMGINASNTVTLYLEDVKVPVENVLGEVGQGFKIAVNILNQGRFGMPCCLSGTMAWTIEKAAEFATSRHQFDRTINNFEDVMEKLSTMAVRQYCSESMGFLLAGIMDLGAKDYQLEAAISKIYSSESAWYCADTAIQIMGGMGYMKDSYLERVMRDLRIFRIFEGANDVLRLFVSLTGIQFAGKYLTANSKSPVGMLNIGVKSLKQRLNVQSLNGFHRQVSPELHESAKLVDESIVRISGVVQTLLMKHKKSIIERQFEVTRLADAVIATYATAAAISRCDGSIKSNTPSAQNEIKLANLAAFQNYGQTKRALDEILNESTQDSFRLMRSISQEISKTQSQLTKTPLGF